MSAIHFIVNKLYPIRVNFVVVSTNKQGRRYRHLESIPCKNPAHGYIKAQKAFPNSTIIPPWSRDQNLEKGL